MARLKLSPRNWVLEKSRTVVARKVSKDTDEFLPINPVFFKVKKPVCIALIESFTAKSSWWSAGFAQSYFYSGAFVNRQFTAFKNWHIGLSRPVLLDFRGYEANQYALEFTFRPWHRHIRLKVWGYNNDLTDATNIDLQRILESVSSLEQKIDDISEYPR